MPHVSLFGATYIFRAVAHFILALFLISEIAAQEPVFIEHELEATFADITINVLMQDNNCMLWLGTSSGIFQYNGFSMKPIHFPDSIADRDVTALYQDQEDVIWIGTRSGGVYHGSQSGKITSVQWEERVSEASITGFVEDKVGQLWMSTYGKGLYMFDGARLVHLGTDTGLLDNDLYHVIADRNGRIWVATDRGINICSYDPVTGARIQKLERGKLPDQITRALHEDKDGNIWIGTYEGGIVRYNAASDTLDLYLEDDDLGYITYLTTFDSLELWVGTSRGLWRYQYQSGRFSRILSAEKLSHSLIRTLVKDIEGNLWVIREDNDIYSTFRPFENLELEIDEVQALYVDLAGTFWVGTTSGLYSGVHGASRTSLEPHLASLGINVTGILADPGGRLWLGTMDHGLIIYDPTEGSYEVRHLNNQVASNTVMAMDSDKHGMWIAMIGGITYLPFNENTQFRSLDHVKKTFQSKELAFVFDVLVDQRGDPWFATDGYGLVTYRNHEIQYYQEPQQRIKTVYSLTEDHRGHLWLSTPDHGLFEFDGDSFAILGPHEGLSNPEVSALATDRNGDILIAHSRGIDVMKPAQRHFMYFDNEVGIKKLVPGLNAYAVDALGHVWFGADGRLIKYSALYDALSIHPRTQLTNVSVLLDPVDFYQTTHFSHNQNHFTFDFIGLWYTSPVSVKYLYKLVGHDLEWKESRDHVTSYSALKPGEYTFRVKASENNFFHDEPIAEYHFTIEKPFWKRAWFIVLAAIMIGSAVYLFMRMRIQRSQRLMRIKKEKIESQFLALKAQINPHFLFNSFNTLIAIIDENKDLAIEYVEKLSDFYRSILQYREKETIPLDEEIGLVRDYYFLLQQRYGKNALLEVNINGAHGDIPPLTLQMLIENAVKHNIISRSKPLTIEITDERPGYITIRNNIQKRIEAKSSTKFGLQSINNRYEVLCDKKVLVEENSNYFEVHVPIIKTKSSENSHH